MKTTRNSSLELLRIICMLFIVMLHYSVWGGYEAFADYEMSGGLMFVQMTGMFAKVGCAVFAMITGYFLINAGTGGGGYYKKLIPLIAQIYFYSFSILFVFLIFKPMPVSARDILRSLFPFAYGGWYAVHYILLYLLVPFINPWLQSLPRKKYTYLLIYIFMIYSIIPSFFAPTVITTETYDFGSMDFMLVFYLTGAYIRMHVKDKVEYRNKWNLTVALASAVLMLLSVIVLDYFGEFTGIDWFVNNARWFAKNFSILVVIMSVSLFLYFVNRTFYNDLINEAAGTVFGIYLIHNNYILREYVWTVLFPNADFIYNPYMHGVIKITVYFFACMLIEMLRKKTIAKYFDKKLVNTCEVICAKMKNRVAQR